MNISDIIFADGKVVDCVTSGVFTTVHLIDYMENLVVIQLTDPQVECDAESFGCSVHHHKLGKDANGWWLELFDDDNERLFFARFSSANVIGPAAP